MNHTYKSNQGIFKVTQVWVKILKKMVFYLFQCCIQCYDISIHMCEYSHIILVTNYECKSNVGIV